MTATAIEVVKDTELKAVARRIAASGFSDARIDLPPACLPMRRGIQHAATSDSVRLGDQDVAFANHSIVIIRRHPQNIEKAVGLLIVEPAAAFAGLARKLPHYGKYSYLAFEGDEPTNMVKGQWSTDGSPLVVDLREDRARRPSRTGSGETHGAGRVATRLLQPLADGARPLAGRSRAGRTWTGESRAGAVGRVHRAADGGYRLAAGRRQRHLVPARSRSRRVPTENRCRR